MSFTCTVLRYKLAFIATWYECSAIDRRLPDTIFGWGMEIFLRVCDIRSMVYSICHAPLELKVRCNLKFQKKQTKKRDFLKSMFHFLNNLILCL